MKPFLLITLTSNGEISSLCLCYLHPNCEYCLLLFSIYYNLFSLIVIHSILAFYPLLLLRNTSTTITSKFSLFRVSEFCVANCIFLPYRKVWRSRVETLLNSTRQTLPRPQKFFNPCSLEGKLFIHQILDIFMFC